MQKIILASTSPRRKELLEQIGLDFEIVPSSYEEDMTLEMEHDELVKTLALGKAKDVAEKIDEGIVIGSDTFLILGGQRIGKPHTEEIARQTLQKISDTEIKVYSGVAVIDVKKQKEITDFILTKVKMKVMSEDEIESYIATGEPLDKAGAFAIQGLGSIFVEKIDGCYSSVIGLPLPLLCNLLKEFGYDILKMGSR